MDPLDILLNQTQVTAEAVINILENNKVDEKVILEIKDIFYQKLKIALE